ncbi:MAG TPA: thiamine phosphate synthase [Candidatus Dormibacteraeota bacterium]|nr:thiamine phosphate synthase [Candidatus Dormibacteraeota bacterium]
MALVPDAAAGLRAVERGATVLQLRNPSATVRAQEREAERLVAASPVPVVVSARVDLALAVGAAGVHLPEHDLPVAGARRLLGRDRLLGRSVHSPAAAREAEEGGADYVVFGPVFPTASHPGREPAGLDALREVVRAVRIPVLAIGGLDPERATACRAAGAGGFAAISHFLADRGPTVRP